MPDLAMYADARGIIRSRAILDRGHRSALPHLVRTGELTKLARGSYLPTSLWRSLDADERYRALIHASATGALAEDELLCGPSALALWRLPALESWPLSVHAVRPNRTSGRRAGMLVRHVSLRSDSGALIDGLPVTTLARTVVDIAASDTLAGGLMAADAALRGRADPPFRRAPLERSALLAEAERVGIRHGRTRALTVARLGNARAESPGESLLRASLHLLGLPQPELQWEFRGDLGRRYAVDCYWPEQRFVLEFDGASKYIDPALRGGRTAEQVLLAEKHREDEIRAQVRGMARVGWHVAASPARLEARLRSAGFQFV